jgi:hypothetical protein
MKEHIFMTILPLIVSNIIHMFLVKWDIFASLNIPVSGSRFGSNKTWRGFILLPLLNAVSTVITASIASIPSGAPIHIGLLGFLSGLAYLLSELPNSYIKRLAGIPPGEKAATNRYFFHLLDKTDSALGVCILYFLLTPVSMEDASLLFLFSVLLHITISKLLVELKIKKTF